jgi:predicted SnoaL-like aldol condensation-catalyzing enzyme
MATTATSAQKTEAEEPTSTEQTSDTAAAVTDVAVRFLTIASAGRAREAWKRHAAPDFIHHNPGVGGGAESLVEAMDANARAYPGKVLEIQRTVAEGPLVAIHSRVRLAPDQPAVATVHLFRIEGGRICEIWDIVQPEPSSSPNPHGMF